MPVAEDLARIAMQEQELQLPEVMTKRRTAWRMGGHVRALAVKRELSLVVDVRSCQPLFYVRSHGTTLTTWSGARRKETLSSVFIAVPMPIGREMEEKKSISTTIRLPSRIRPPWRELPAARAGIPARQVGLRHRLGQDGKRARSSIVRRCEGSFGAELGRSSGHPPLE